MKFSNELFFQLLELLARLQVLVREGLLCHFEAEGFAKTQDILNVHLFVVRCRLLELEDQADEFVVLVEEHVQLVRPQVAVNSEVLVDLYLRWAVLFI